MRGTAVPRVSSLSPVRLLPLLAAVPLLLGGAPVAAASAATGASPAPFGPATSACVPVLSANATGAVYGAGSCSGGGVSIYQRPASGGAFRSTGVLWKGYTAVDVADDGASTFVLMFCNDGVGGGYCQEGDPAVGAFAVAKLPHGGRPSAVTTLGDAGGSGTIAAAGGRWVAAFESRDFRRSDEERSNSRITIRGTVGNGVRALLRPDDYGAQPEPSITDPAVAITPDGPVVAHLAQDRPADDGPELRTATVSASGTVTTAPYAPAAGAAAGPPAVAVSGTRTFVAWPRAGRLALAYDGTRRDLSTRGTVTRVCLAASGGRAFLGDQEEFAYAGGTTTRVYLRQITLDGAVGSVELSAAAGRRSPTVRAAISDVTAARGRATVSFYDGNRFLLTSQ